MTFFFSSFLLNTIHDVKIMRIIDLENPLLSKSTLIEFKIIFDGLYGCKINLEEDKVESQKENY